MNYALIENETVVNIIVGPVPDGVGDVPVGEIKVRIGDTYENGRFYRDGEPLLTMAETVAEQEARIEQLQQFQIENDTALIELAEMIVGGGA